MESGEEKGGPVYCSGDRKRKKFTKKLFENFKRLGTVVVGILQRRSRTNGQTIVK